MAFHLIRRKTLKKNFLRDANSFGLPDCLSRLINVHLIFITN